MSQRYLNEEEVWKIVAVSKTRYSDDKADVIYELVNTGQFREDDLARVIANPVSPMRGLAVLALGKLGKGEHLPLILSCLDDDSAYLRETAVQALGNLPDERSFQALLAALRDSSASVREIAAAQLAHLKDVRSIEALLDAINDESDFVQENIEWALDEMWEATLPYCRAILENETADNRHAHAIHALFALERLEESSLIVPYLHHADPVARYYALIYLARAGHPEYVDFAVAALDDEATMVRVYTALLLGGADAKVIPALEARLAIESDPDVSQVLQQVLKRLCGDSED